MSTSALALCVAIGFISGAFNVFAGGGSFLTLPLLLFLGVPAPIANGTNRVGVMAQSVSTIWGFHRHQVMEWRWALSVSGISVVGAAIGAWGALHVAEFAFRRTLSIAMLAITLWTLLRRSDQPRPAGPPRVGPFHWSMLLGFFVIGLYGGFLQAGIGFLVLAMTTMAGLDLVRGNAVKGLNVMLITIVSLAIFGSTGHIDWPLGLALGAGSFAGGLVGVRVAVLQGHRWIERVVTIAIVAFAILLWITD